MILGIQGKQEAPQPEQVLRKRRHRKAREGSPLPNVVKTKQFEWAAAKIRYTMNKLYMYKMSVVWISGVILSVAIMCLLKDTSHVYHNMHAFREGFINQEFLFEDTHIQKNYLDIDEAVCFAHTSPCEAQMNPHAHGCCFLSPFLLLSTSLTSMLFVTTAPQCTSFDTNITHEICFALHNSGFAA